MRLASQEFKNQEGGNILRVDISWPDDLYNPVSFTYDDISAFNYSADGIQPSSMGFGLTSICTFTMSLINTSGRWDNVKFKGAKAQLFIGKRLPTRDEFIKIGDFTIESGVKNEGAIKITAEDNMALLDTRFRGIAFPCTIRDLIQQICVQVGISLSTHSLTNFSKIIDTNEDVTTLTCREILSLACELLGVFAIMNSDGELELRWFDTNILPVTVHDQFITSCKPEEAIPPTGVSAFFSGAEFLAGSDESLIYLSEDNTLVRNLSTSDQEDIIKNIYHDSILSFNYDAGELEASGNCLLEPGDTVRFEHRGYEYKFIVSSIRLTNNLTMHITSTAPTAASTSRSRGNSSGPSESSSIQIAHMLSYDDASLNPQPSATTAIELISVFITQSGTHVPVALFSTTFEFSSEDDVVAKVRFSLNAGSVEVHSFEQNCHLGSNMISFSWPLMDLPQGASKISVTASITNSSESYMSFSWLAGDTSFIVLGKSFTTVATWNGLLFLSDVFRPIDYIAYTSPGFDLARVNVEAGSQISEYQSPEHTVTFGKLLLSSDMIYTDTLSIRKDISDSISISKEGS